MRRERHERDVRDMNRRIITLHGKNCLNKRRQLLSIVMDDPIHSQT